MVMDCLILSFMKSHMKLIVDIEVELTFSDFGVLDRLDFDKTGEPINLRMLILTALQKCCNDTSTPWNIKYLTSTTIPGISSQVLKQVSSLCVSPANFYDEEDEPMTWKEVLQVYSNHWDSK